MISFSIIVLYSFISLLLVTVGIIYIRIGSNVDVVINILFDGENISFDTSLVIYSPTCFDTIVSSSESL